MENLSSAFSVENQAILSDDAAWSARDWLQYLASEWRSAKSRELDALGGKWDLHHRPLDEIFRLSCWDRAS